VLQDLAASLKRRGLIILISDLLDEPQDVAKGLKQLRARGSEVIVFHLMDREELEFPFKEPCLFQDMEADLRLLADPQAIRPAYLKALRSLMDRYRQACVAHQIDYSLFDTSVGLDQALVRYLTWRQKFRPR
jgi:glycine/D-amino acid oxidase-like deaminating enzyme